MATKAVTTVVAKNSPKKGIKNKKGDREAAFLCH